MATPKHFIGTSSSPARLRTDRHSWRSAVGNLDRGPHAAIAISASDKIAVKCIRFSGPTGSRASASMRISVARKANTLPTIIRDHPSRLPKPITRRIVGSSTSASALDGFTITTAAVTPNMLMFRSKRYLYCPHALRTADMPLLRLALNFANLGAQREDKQPALPMALRAHF